MKKIVFAVGLLLGALAASAETVVKLRGAGAEKIPVSVDVQGSAAFTSSLKKNLDLSGCFQIVPNGAIKVTGTVGASVTAEGRGKALTLPSRAADDKAARMEARKLADKMCEAYANQKGCAQDKIALVMKKGGDVSELCTCYPDGYDLKQLTAKGKNIVGPRWRTADKLFYTGIFNAGPQVFEIDAESGLNTLKWSFRGLSTGAAVSPDGGRVAIILSVHGNPELYVIDIASGTWTRLTTTKFANEGQPCWSPDGREIAYVSDETRRPMLYKIDLATRQKTRLTSAGSQNVDPDWGEDGRIVYVSKRPGGNFIAVLDPKVGESSVELVGEAGDWEHPSWARDSRHVVASSRKLLYVVDTFPKEKGGAQPKAVFKNPGNWITPSWSRR